MTKSLLLAALIWLASWPALATIALDPSGSASGITNATSGTTIAVTLSTTNAADCIYVDAVALPNSGFGATIADTVGLTWTARTGSPYSPGGGTLNAWTAPAPSTLSSDTIMVTADGTMFFVTMIAFAISGCNTSSMFDPNLSGGPVTGNPDPVAITTTNANDMIIGVCGGGSQSAPGAGSGFTLVQAGNFVGNEIKVVSTTQSALSVTYSPSGDCGYVFNDAIQASSAAAAAAMSMRSLLGSW